jgi:transposase
VGAARIKHDKLDARVLAELCQSGLLAAIDIPSQEQRLARLPFTARDALVRSRTLMSNNVRSILDGEGIEVPSNWPGNLCEVVRNLASHMPPAMVPIVVGPLTAAGFVHIIRNPARFKSGRLVAAYLGLVPSLYASGKTFVMGGITKHGNKHLRWLLHIAATALLRTLRDTALKRWAAKLAERIGRKKAKSAIARKLATVLWAVWRRRRPCEVRLPLVRCQPS